MHVNISSSSPNLNGNTETEHLRGQNGRGVERRGGGGGGVSVSRAASSLDTVTHTPQSRTAALVTPGPASTPFRPRYLAQSPNKAQIKPAASGGGGGGGGDFKNMSTSEIAEHMQQKGDMTQTRGLAEGVVQKGRGEEEKTYGVGMRIHDDAPHRVISLVPFGAAARSGQS
jgi:hypothetical protein